MARRIPYIGDEPTSFGGVILPPDFTGTLANDLVSLADSPGVASLGNPRTYGSPLGSPGPNMTAANAPAPYTVIGEQPSDHALPSTAVMEWGAPAWGLFSSTVARGYLQTYDFGYATQQGQTWLLRKEVLADRTTLREPRRITYGGPRRRYHSYTIRSAFNGREPLAWTLHGGDSAAGPWTLLDTRTHTIGSPETNPLQNTAEPLFAIDPALMPAEGFTHYQLTMTKVHPPTVGGFGYIDLAKIAFYEHGFAVRSTARVIPATTTRAGLIVRVGGRTNLTSADVVGELARDAALTFKGVALSPVASLPDLTTLFAGEVAFNDAPAGTSLIARLKLPARDLRLFGWTFGALH